MTQGLHVGRRILLKHAALEKIVRDGLPQEKEGKDVQRHLVAGMLTLGGGAFDVDAPSSVCSCRWHQKPPS